MWQLPNIAANGYVYGVVWRFEAQTCQNATPFIRCNSLEISTMRQMHYTGCCVPVLYVRSLSVRLGSHTLWQVLACAWACATCQCVWMRRVGHIVYNSIVKFSFTASLKILLVF